MNANNIIPFVSSYGEQHCTTHFISCDDNNGNWKHCFSVMDNELQLLYDLLQNKMGNNDGHLFYADIDNVANRAMAPLQHDG